VRVVGRCGVGGVSCLTVARRLRGLLLPAALWCDA
jgi:hypothetical protein